MSRYLFTPGPVPMQQDICDIGGEQTPYFRNDWFSQVVKECETNLLDCVNAPEGSRAIFLTASGTGAMEASVINLLKADQKTLVVNGGSFGQRFADLCDIHHKPYQSLHVADSDLSDIADQCTADSFCTLLINAHETSVGRLYNLQAVGQFCRENGLLNIVDGISMFVTDPLDMTEFNIDALIISSHKALGLHAGLSMVILSPRAIEALNERCSMYFDFHSYLNDGERGQTPFTPAINILMQLQHRLRQLVDGGLAKEVERAKEIAHYFREQISPLPLGFYSQYMPNAMTTLSPLDGRSAAQVVLDMEQNYGMVLTPNGGELRDKVFRVSHMGCMDIRYTDQLLDALFDYYGAER
ncbi:pyridoxal-phosphate-dependent aminotransferase family protein [Oceanospirillum sediminis]|uniref:Alanine--glyoxylate aminotransferase family protein n=1 Tax=Oceanospirillum sediminis TaxID=2760088 RepID=A0A839IUC2_9GAMM|nr:aminotransferase class V-fold PLP-dependent enzyme [Oceanospirillum sediminis]MBB1488955.1 alanine--glyoxylate aminotransferase family protein [Oceanospirillum sediminis]